MTTVQVRAASLTDVGRVQEGMQALISQLDVRTPQVQISAKIVFVDRTDLKALGITYDLKDSRGNQLNQTSPGGTDTNGNGVIDPSEKVDIGTNVFSLLSQDDRSMVAIPVFPTEPSGYNKRSR